MRSPFRGIRSRSILGGPTRVFATMRAGRNSVGCNISKNGRNRAHELLRSVRAHSAQSSSPDVGFADVFFLEAKFTLMVDISRVFEAFLTHCLVIIEIWVVHGLMKASFDRTVKGIKHACRSLDAVKFSTWMLSGTGRMFALRHAFKRGDFDRQTLVLKSVPIRVRMNRCLQHYAESSDYDVRKVSKSLIKTLGRPVHVPRIRRSGTNQ